ncbi:DUF6445 family protein [Teredinibacter purpureus]|uniref:DUF6445 family protein n=1 Tax=Teredinibacter purpureus TaxID=2731756 RepID=UPI0005F77270|nr:DUF6445 family protein [Teredinibacter purpureus]
MTNTLQHPNYRYSVNSIGDEKQPLLVIDNVFSQADSLIDYALTQQNVAPAKGFYPGMRSPSPPRYIDTLLSVAGDAIEEAFGQPATALVSSESFFSIVATPFEQLSPPQRVPHFDRPEPESLAVIHYLCGAPYGGTSFYRHRKTGYEYIDQARVEGYMTQLDKEVRTEGIGRYKGYISGDTPLFERVASYEATFNRALIYRCSSLHSGNIPDTYPFDLNPRTGRFTVTSFLYP